MVNIIYGIESKVDIFIYLKIYIIVLYILFYSVFRYSIMHEQAYVCICMYMYAYTSTCFCVCMCMCACVCQCVWISVCEYLFVCLNMFLFACFTNYNLPIVLPAMYKVEAYISTSLLLPPFSIQYVTL